MFAFHSIVSRNADSSDDSKYLGELKLAVKYLTTVCIRICILVLQRGSVNVPPCFRTELGVESLKSNF